MATRKSAATSKSSHLSVTLDRFAHTLADVAKVARANAAVTISADVEHTIVTGHRLLQRLIEQGREMYGVTTGVGDLCKTRINLDQAAKLSRNIVISHACGVGEPLSVEQVRAIMFCAIVNFSQGYSGVRPQLVHCLVDMLNRGVTPWVPSQGSLGSLTHMAHVGLVLMGVGQAYFRGQLMSGATAMQKAGLATLELREKEGLSMVSATPSKTGIGGLALYDALRLAAWTDVAGALSCEALLGDVSAFDERVHKVRPHPGQMKVAENLLRLLAGSEILATAERSRIQDAMSLRAMPQVHGACRDQIQRAAQVAVVELNSATDNPLLFEQESTRGLVISAANPHGEAMALAMDQVALAVAELGNISERRIDRLVNHYVSGLPPFLVKNSGLNSGFMIPQYVAASLVAENKVLSHPMSVDSIPTTALQEDHHSMGTPAALKVSRSVRNAQKVVAIELLTACQALEFHRPKQLGAGTQVLYDLLRQQVPAMEEDRVLYPDMHAVIEAVEDGGWLDQVEQQVGALV